MQHNCAGNECTTSGTRAVLEERENSGRTVPIVTHRNSTNLMLNTAQMRDAKHVQKFRIPSTEIEGNVWEKEIFTAVEREVAVQTAKSKLAANTKGKGKSNTRGQSAAPPTANSSLNQRPQLATVQHKRVYDISYGHMYNTNK